MTAKKRAAIIHRVTKETDVLVKLSLDVERPVTISTTIPFLDHMLELLAGHGGFSLCVKASGDTAVDDHHLVEDTGITLGQALAKALGDKAGITRYGKMLLPMDEALSYVAIDLSGRPYLEYEARIAQPYKGFDYDLLREFFQALAVNTGMNLHIALLKGRNNHHMAEAIFKGVGRALAEAVERRGRRTGIPSTKGLL